MKAVINIFMMLLFLLTSCIFLEPEWEGTVRYEVTGTATDVDIEYRGADHAVTLHNQSLPWKSGRISARAGDQSDYGAWIDVISNTPDNVTIDVKIYVDGKLEAHESGAGPDCEVSARFCITNEY